MKKKKKDKRDLDSSTER